MNKNNELMEAINRAAAPKTPVKTATKAAVKPPTKKAPSVPSSARRGMATTIYLHPEDKRNIRAMVAFISGQEIRVSDSQVVKAALEVANGNGELLKAVQIVLDRDQRFKKARDAKAQG